MKKIGFVGAGSMAEAMINGFLQSGITKPENIYITNRSNEERLNELKEMYGVRPCRDKSEFFTQTDIVVLAFKPKDAAESIDSIRSYMKDQLVISVLAGLTIETIQHYFGRKLAVIRVMPNTSAAIRKSATGFSVSAEASQDDITAATALLETIGDATLVEEQHLDAVTAIAGSGPAYLYRYIEAMEKAAQTVGLEEETAKKLILQTMAGATDMLRQSGKQPAQLRREITSPGGTTEAGLRALTEARFEEAIIHCIEETAKRSAEIKEQFAGAALEKHL
ncbi:pyrroline-5-carboxylate reductase [Bacillus halotolerans]|uniref:Pyrroline-5-carboxylate reductase n=1 Tax=Bacillus halotolerans TaxID=260554 RepID=A0A9Q4HQJ8_9BACI|nr:MULTISPECIES: pyrroline-5-carboxylate reductase [Bacillus]MBL6009585.1 pyrroline-5-carboxylate reductase [Bacillus halotolerans]MBU5244961.1 pyrroline-5-carboxylate reductase [Bacillus halotolerans]MCP9298708.1 pyrroline-5-carboxylate reductase [Bacillus halotolerans]MCY9184402.1 pyrroline-5-carboxylate reductase [Bacillus halotolerans]MCY9199966.1 pyrroline-5-carboxylate reductase [Bacillus halotolerans]